MFSAVSDSYSILEVILHTAKKLDALMEEDYLGMARISCSSARCSTNPHKRWSTSGVYDDVLNISPRVSYHNPTICVERRLHGSLSFPEKALEHSSTSSIASNETPLPKTICLGRRIHERSSLCFPEKASDTPLQKPAAELVEEIAALEMEVIELERYLLSLYRTAFEQKLPGSSLVVNYASRSSSRCDAGSLRHDSKIQVEHQADRAVDSSHPNDKMNQLCSHEAIEKSTRNHKQNEKSHPHYLANGSNSHCTSTKQFSKNDMSKTHFGHRRLADHLGASFIDHVPNIHCRLSEDIVRCISAIYCKLANPPRQQIDLLASPTPSVSSSSTFSPQEPRDSWSPRCHYEGAASPQFASLKNKSGPYSSMIEVPKICVDGDKFDYASKMLGIFRSLIRRLDTIDPRKMEHGEQLAFWINIHNALVMHAFLAYGLHQNHMKSTSSIMKAAYTVGGHSVNAGLIQRAILGCQLHRPALSLRILFSPTIKYMTGNIRHPYALDQPEPLAHFALSLGAYSDPAVRVYTARGIHQELKLAKAEFIQANVSVQKESRIILPKILHYYAKDASLELPKLMEMICECMPAAQQKVIQGCFKQKADKFVEWSPYKSAFRYLVHRDLAK